MPLSCNCPLAAVEPSSRITTGKRCNILCCIDFGQGGYYTQSLIYNLTFNSMPSEPSEPHSMLTSHSHSLHPHAIMSRLHHRMGSRRGSSRDRLPRSLPSTISDSSSPTENYVSGRYLETRNGRGCLSTTHSLPLQTTIPNTDIPSSSRHPNHSDQFIYHFSLNRPLIKATITVTFQEEPSSDKGHPTSAMEKRDNAQSKTIAAEQNQEPRAKDDTGVLHNDEDGLDAYKCFIIEEHPAAPHDT